MERKILILIITLLLLFLCFGVGYRKGRDSVEIKSDTVFVEKVIANHKPLYTNEIPVSIQKIKVPVIAVLSEYTDSSKQTVIKLKHSLDSLANLTDSLEFVLHRVQRYYSGNDYEAWVSGIDPLLDSIKIKQQVQQIVNTTSIKEKMFSFNVGLNATGWVRTSYCLNPNINVSFVKNRVEFIGEAGFNIPTNDMSKTLPYLQIGVNYSLWSF